ncbi:MAG: Rod shape determining protein RodA [Parcubacteria group bacterium]|nr:Rod shape determining protein RodA [Parcubacteria group bacterium]
MTETARSNPFRALLSTWPLLATAVTLSLLGILTMSHFDGTSSLAPRQLIWLGISVIVYIACSLVDMRFIRRPQIIVAGYVLAVVLLAGVMILGHTTMGAKSWFSFGFFAFQPADFAKLVIIALLAKYFSRRHMEMGNFTNIIVSGLYASAIILLILLQPDLGTAVIFMSVWLGLVLVSGIPLRHLAFVGLAALVLAAGLWSFGLKEHQRQRIMTFVNPAADIRGTGYNAYQATIATGSGQLWGKGIGYGTQSKLRFLPEYQTDFIFAAYAEEWGFAGIMLLFLLYGFLLFQLLSIARRSATNFDALFTLGVLILFLAHMGFHAGISLGLLPVTGTTIPFMSSGGSHVVIEFAALGIIASLAQQGRSVPRERAMQEYEG